MQLYKQSGVILMQRKKQYDQCINYVNQALFEEVISKNQITSVYQNDSRVRSGKISEPLSADNSIQWLLRACKSRKLS